MKWSMITVILIWIALASPSLGGESRPITVSDGRRARIRSVSVPDGAGFRIVESRKGWTVYRSWGDSSAVSGVVLGPGTYRVISDDPSPVSVDFELE